MPRSPRHDGSDTWHHVMNRGLARRPIFENDHDRRFFLSLLAREVNEGRIEVHAFSLLITHFHVLLRSLKGELSEAMRRIQYRYSRYFNRTRDRDGPLYKGRFLSCPIETLRYRRRVLVYIHDNAVDAKIAADPSDYAWASAVHFARDPKKRPPWLESSWVEAEIAARGSGDTGRERLATAFPSRIDPDFRLWVAKQLNSRWPDEIEDTTLKYAGSPKVVRWAMRNAKRADDTRAWQPVRAAGHVERLLGQARNKLGPLLGLFRRRTKDAWITLRAGLLRLLAGSTHREIGLFVGRHSATISRDIRDHLRLLKTVPRYEAITSQVAHAVLAADH